MKNKFLSLPKQTRINAFNQIAEKKGITPFAVEKDWWVTQSLSVVFGMNVSPHLIFKGGTSLSKSWDLIQRFSEDIDLAIDREFLGFVEVPKRKTSLRKRSGKYISEEFYTELQKGFTEKGISEGVNFDLEEALSSDQDPRIINIYYPTIIDNVGYIQPRVQIEVGCRSLKEPYSDCLISSFIDKEYEKSDFSESPFHVPSVNPERTFLEKIFLLHEEFQKAHNKIRVNRLSRHLYDVHSLYYSEYKTRALKDKELYQTIVHHRLEFTKVKDVDYSLHNPQTINPIPPDSIIKKWEQDYEKMKTEMLYSKNRPSFSEIIQTLKKLKSEINSLDWKVFE